MLNKTPNTGSAAPNTPRNNVLYPEQRTYDLDQELAYAASTAKQSPVPQSVGKRLPTGKRLPPPTQQGCDGGDDDITPDDSASNLSCKNRGREVDSPVGGVAEKVKKQRKKKNGHRRRRSPSTDSSSSSSSDSESSGISASVVSRASAKGHGDEKSDKKKRKTGSQSHSRSGSRLSSTNHAREGRSPEKRLNATEKPSSNNANKRDRSRSESQNRSPVPIKKSKPVGEKRRKDANNDDDTSMGPPSTPTIHRAHTPLDGRKRAKQAVDAPPPPPEDPEIVEQVFEQVMREKSNALRGVVLGGKSTVSRSTASRFNKSRDNQRRCTTKEQPLTEKHLISLLPEDLQNRELAVSTVKVIVRSFPRGSKNNLISEAVGLIRHFPPISEDVAQDYLQIDASSYLFSAFKSGVFGFDIDTIRKDDSKYNYTLYHALTPVYAFTDDNSLDFVFRQCLKNMCLGLEDEYDYDVDMSITNQILICGRYLELTLIDKIRSHYKQAFGEDIIEYLTSACPQETSKFKKHVKGAFSEMYIRKLVDRYRLTKESYQKIYTELPLAIIYAAGPIVKNKNRPIWQFIILLQTFMVKKNLGPISGNS